MPTIISIEQIKENGDVNSKILFELALGQDLTMQPATLCPSDYKNITLVCREYAPKGHKTAYDLMYAWHDSKDEGVLYLGQYNYWIS
jgi:hypothetical protein